MKNQCAINKILNIQIHLSLKWTKNLATLSLDSKYTQQLHSNFEPDVGDFKLEAQLKTGVAIKENEIFKF